jgi:hypothetical protein
VVVVEAQLRCFCCKLTTATQQHLNDPSAITALSIWLRYASIGDPHADIRKSNAEGMDHVGTFEKPNEQNHKDNNNKNKGELLRWLLMLFFHS